VVESDETNRVISTNAAVARTFNIEVQMKNIWCYSGRCNCSKESREATAYVYPNTDLILAEGMPFLSG
jgi:hypothetical protein